MHFLRKENQNGIKMFSTVLIANRGEIACRVIRSAKKNHIKTIAIYSDADENALHVKLADEAIYIGPSPALQSYLNAQAIIAAAKKSGAQAIHPGYGFLSENAEFAAECQRHNIIFIGPSSDAMTKMADKGAAKKVMQQAGIPVIPGGEDPSKDPKKLQSQAEKIGFPILLKACAGGGGKGMRAVNNSAEFEQACQSAQREAMKSFGDDTLIVEKYFPRAKHIEVQIFGDSQGNCVYLFERDCSLQRRYQKIIEEAPAPHLSESLREEMGKAAVAAAKAIHYSGAGTIEFLVTPDNKFYFMEMNTRLQVEHPITECITGLDLVEWQFLVANGEPLPLKQHEIKLTGHAIEARLYAEDPANNFLPTIGKIRLLEWPATNVTEESVLRIDTGVIQGDEISVYYDPMIAKIIVWNRSRQAALQNLTTALAQTNIVGLTTNLRFLQTMLTQPIVERGEQYTTFIQETEIKIPALEQDILVVIAAAYYWQNLDKNKQNNNPWTFRDAWRSNLPTDFYITFFIQEELYGVDFIEKRNNKIKLILNKKEYQIEILENTKQFVVIVNDEKYHTLIEQDKAYLYLAVHGQQCVIGIQHLMTTVHQPAGEELANLRSPMPGTIISLPVKKGDFVKAGDILLIIEAMKMEHTIKAPTDGIVKAVYFNEGDFVSEGTELVEFE
jgi:3-methylcrotonyl-CoA carboxylase alpha subunit